MYFLYLILILAPVSLLYWAYQLKKRVNQLDKQLRKINYDDNEVKKALRTGLYYMFNERGIDFEHFVAKIMENYYQGSSYVTPPTRDFGVDIELTKKNGENKELYLGQVKCNFKQLNYRPIAIIHSQMVKQNAKKGFVVTTGDFTIYAKWYAKNLNVDLIS